MTDLERPAAPAGDAAPGPAPARRLAVRSRPAWARLLAVTLPALLLAAIGTTHPVDLTPATAEWWRNLHLIVLPVFPLLGAGLCVLVAEEGGVLAWCARAAAYGYGVLYTGLDLLAGVGAGAVALAGVRDGVGVPRDAVDALFDIGNALGGPGAQLYLVAALLTVVVLARRVGRAAAPGAVVLLAGAWLFLGSHIYAPVGVGAMLALAIGGGLLAVARDLGDMRLNAVDRR